MTTEFQSLLGEEAAHLYPLRTWLGGAVYSTVHGEESQPAAIKLMQVDGADRERQLAMWQEAAQLSHPGLLRILDFGRCEIQGAPYAYVVMERAEGNLAEVLTERSLTAAEAQEMLTCTAAALSYLHEHGFVHGGIKPAHILAAGDQIKLATDSVVRGNEAGDDVRALGFTLSEALKPLPPAFQEIVERCLRQDGLTAPQIASYWSGPAAPAEPAAQRSRWPLYSIAAGMAVITAIVLFLRSGPGPTAAPAVQPTTSHAAIAALPAEPAAPEAKPNEGWYVVAATYSRKADAEKRANSIRKKWPRFNAELYSPPGGGYYLVVLGSDLSQRAAAAVQQRARAAGLPRDTYIKRLPR